MSVVMGMAHPAPTPPKRLQSPPPKHLAPPRQAVKAGKQEKLKAAEKGEKEKVVKRKNDNPLYNRLEKEAGKELEHFGILLRHDESRKTKKYIARIGEDTEKARRKAENKQGLGNKDNAGNVNGEQDRASLLQMQWKCKCSFTDRPLPEKGTGDDYTEARLKLLKHILKNAQKHSLYPFHSTIQKMSKTSSRKSKLFSLSTRLTSEANSELENYGIRRQAGTGEGGKPVFIIADKGSPSQTNVKWKCGCPISDRPLPQGTGDDDSLAAYDLLLNLMQEAKDHECENHSRKDKARDISRVKDARTIYMFQLNKANKGDRQSTDEA
ncbi:uncharacterized protein FOMMEDRAFT_29549 [Fomitiporia mediterranea MF3/22]|uniref:uncharacterized protein n=1 Tax=Fomitiporia mediterranea (strain MF3/22) TaxID=694068 RepID=UPI0004407AE0|nr:uncharacterized protein FOMMEDRAFT_29549 [Fomitiporia mediterranea MF3/22]EJD00697.1 hypothetical protein FOMMEDRAFT_29549 [Fomitiporia mediterranea MF3/22]